MKQDKDKWIEEVLESTAGMSPAAPPEGRFDRVMSKISTVSRAPRTISLTRASAAAACLLVLIALNFTLLANYNTAGKGSVANTEASVQDIVDYYELGSNTSAL